MNQISERRRRKRSKKAVAGITAGSLAVVLAAVAAVDAYDVFPELPGILTTDPAIEVQAIPAPDAQGKDLPAPASALDDSAPVPTTVPDKVDKVLSDAKVKGFGIELRDGLSDDILYAKKENRPRTPASVTKVLTASAALLTIGGQKRLSTTTEFDPSTSTVTLTGGGDSLLGAGESLPGAVNGHAGLTTLAQRTAESLQSQNVAEVALDLDTSRYTGEDFSPGWERGDIAKGVITPIQPLMIDTGYVGSKDKEWRGRSEHPAKDAFAVFSKKLKAAGITVTDTPKTAAETGGAARPDGDSETSELAEVESATISEIVEYALVHSDNVVAEVLGNEVAIAQGEPGSLEAAPEAVLAALSDSVDLGSTHLEDTSGLSYDNQISPHDLTTILQASVVADDSLASLISYLPVGGLTGTLTQRFTKDKNAAGTVHAKTGTLSTVTSLAGGVLDADGRYLVFTLQIDDVDKDKILEARKTVDDIVAALANCGCR
ncbi:MULTISPECIES: D-alanyl-D-alanine carboxypeptidase/D-alanyl-D-alanine-endopeptidase [Brevibacterium]|uniref:D-alanyl-D-alanine carboxypeptidase / D-alanyl-D-alanine-endopeptidase (Penicillin-binding protein 4) n=1 Tax=Brevibacterium antiquum CNRZ 918 TaxID=1255637 RepID=A0A2H1IZU8_9MICO|nr:MULTISPECIES: D-alanyl-D-alanine carboxypeptidase/D-alanyl-D-alanine-endopeptidase [Brevibacterium]SMX80668.1 D-alanyl-D-alanine carboxypeptidase / D-alanyl-D-alanine-endopeptidase (penicillin-binding protein 4) [Brevibacterium antiquum CNRZ 918]HCG55243.1 D-alanyl-D-alanine carboxypeptidase/D-alanyl-D-alanine-endopeptidase [Brevibacterium sp.]